MFRSSWNWRFSFEIENQGRAPRRPDERGAGRWAIVQQDRGSASVQSSPAIPASIILMLPEETARSEPAIIEKLAADARVGND